MAKYDDVIEKLGLLHGHWKGNGRGQFPTIDSFEYEETLVFEVALSYPLIHYQQRTVLTPSGESSHWECGFIRILEDGSIEVSNAQDGGRVEVLQGTMTSMADKAFALELTSIVLAHDPRLIKSKREFGLKDHLLSYKKYMATNTTDTPALLHHLSAELRKQN